MHETDIIYKKYLFYTYIASTKKLRKRGVKAMRTTRTVKRFNYAKAAFYVWTLAMIIFVATNAAAKFAALGH